MMPMLLPMTLRRHVAPRRDDVHAVRLPYAIIPRHVQLSPADDGFTMERDRWRV